MLCRARVITKKVRKRTLLYILSVPILSFIYGILSSTTAVAEEAQSSSGGDAGTNNNANSNASSEVIQTGSSAESTQGPLTEASTAVSKKEMLLNTIPQL